MSVILVIDDEEQIRAFLRRVLEREGHHVLEAPNGEVGLRLCEENELDLIITDIIMPDKEGIETIMELRQNQPDMKIIAISGGGTAMPSDACLRLAERLGAARTFPKPLDLQGLLGAIRELLSG